MIGKKPEPYSTDSNRTNRHYNSTPSTAFDPSSNQQNKQSKGPDASGADDIVIIGVPVVSILAGVGVGCTVATATTDDNNKGGQNSVIEQSLSNDTPLNQFPVGYPYTGSPEYDIPSPLVNGVLSGVAVAVVIPLTLALIAKTVQDWRDSR